MTENRPEVRRATKKDAADLAILTNIASKGLSHWRWQQQVDAGKASTAFDFGRAEIADDDNMFGYRHGVVVEVDGIIAGGFISCPIDETLRDDDFISSGPMAPMGELNKQARGGWFIDSIAIFDAYRRRGLGSFMLQTAEDLAQKAGFKDIYLIAISNNESALNLYEDNGFREKSRLPFIDWNDGSTKDDVYWLLLQRKLVQK